MSAIYSSSIEFLSGIGGIGSAFFAAGYVLTAVLIILTSFFAFYSLKRKTKTLPYASYESIVRGSIAAHQTADMLKSMTKTGNHEQIFSIENLLNQELYSKVYSLFSCCDTTAATNGDRDSCIRLKHLIFSLKIYERKARFFHRIMAINTVNRSILNDHIRKYGLLPHTISEQLAYQNQVDAMEALNKDMQLVGAEYRKILLRIKEYNERIRVYIENESMSFDDIMTIEDECVESLSDYECRLGEFFNNGMTESQKELFDPQDAEYEQKLTENIRGDCERAYLLAAIAFYDLEQAKFDLLHVSDNRAKRETLYLKALHRAEEARSFAVSIGEISLSDEPGRHIADRISRIPKPKYNYVAENISEYIKEL